MTFQHLKVTPTHLPSPLVDSQYIDGRPADISTVFDLREVAAITAPTMKVSPVKGESRLMFHVSGASGGQIPCGAREGVRNGNETWEKNAEATKALHSAMVALWRVHRGNRMLG